MIWRLSRVLRVGTMALVGTDSGALELWNLAQKQLVESFNRHKGKLSFIRRITCKSNTKPMNYLSC